MNVIALLYLHDVLYGLNNYSQLNDLNLLNTDSLICGG
jgi:hypothetical protein